MLVTIISPEPVIPLTTKTGPIDCATIDCDAVEPVDLNSMVHGEDG